MKKSSFIRWKFVVPTGIGVALVVLFFVFAFDFLLAKGIEIVGSRVNGAKVEVSGLSTKLFQGRLALKRLQVTDPSNTWINMVEAGPMSFQLDPSELVSKRVIIPEASLQGLEFGTARKTDGRLPKRSVASKSEKPSAVAALTEKYKDKFVLNFEGMKAEAKEKVDVDPKKLNLTKQADDLKAKADSLPDVWKSKVDNLKADDRLKQIDADIKEVSSASPLDKLFKIKKAKSEIEALKNDLQSTRQQFSTDLTSVKTGVAGLQDAKKRDLNDLLSRFNLDFANPKRLVEGMIGNSLLEKVKVGLHYVEMAKAYMPSKKDQALPPPRPRFKGIDIPFPTPAAPPRFWLKKAVLSGLYKAIAADGSLSDVTTDPVRVGRPLRLDLKGQSAANPFLLNALADHTGSISKDSLHLVAGNLSVQEFLKGGLLGDSLKGGSGDLDFSLKVVEGAPLDGVVNLSMKGLKIDESSWLAKAGVESHSPGKEDAFKAQFLTRVARGFESMPAFTVGAGISGTWASPEISIHSNAEEMLGRVIKESVGSLVSGQQKELEQKLDAILKDRTTELNQKTSGLQDKLNGLLSGPEKEIQEKLAHATGLGGGSSPLKIPSLDKFFK